MNMDELYQTFLEEARDLLTEMESALLQWELQPGERELVNAVFRSMHTIKGNSGIFGALRIERFTHIVENVLVRVREGELTLDGDLHALLLKCRDFVAAALERPVDDADPELDRWEQSLLTHLRGYLQDTASPPSAADAAGATSPEPAPAADAGAWHISVRFRPEVLEHGFDPLGCLRYLTGLGDLVFVETVADAMPPAADMNPEHCYLGFELQLRSSAGKGEIESAFEFVADFCELRILPPDSKHADYLRLIETLPEGQVRTGEILVACGALTEAELARALKQQQEGQGRIGEVLVEQGAVARDLVQAALKKQQRASQYVRVQAHKLDALINLVGELVIANASAQLAAQQGGDGATVEAVTAVANLVEEIRDGSLQLRMVPIGETFQRFQRLVRDTAAELGKAIELEISGADTELDKTVVEKISDPLTHLIRNAMDHGIETADVRLGRGKPAGGQVRLNAYHDSGSIVIEVGDDGGGLNRDRILAKAVERGLVQPGDSLSDAEVYDLIFAAGFSTAEKVTNLSGRGVGMDVVRRSIEALRGTVEVASRPGQGSTFRIRLPLTLAIIDGFLVRVGHEHYVLPLESVVECVDLDGAQRAEASERGFINLRGEVLPVVDVRRQFGIDGRPGRRLNVVVARCGGQKVGLPVDELLGEYQTVIKPLGELFRHIVGISGSTVLGNGRVALILDVPALVHRIGDRDRSLLQRSA